MKRILNAVVAILVALFVVSTPVRAVAQDKMDVTIIGGSIAGAWYAMAQGIAESIKKAHPGTRADVVPGGDAGNVIRIGNNEATFAFCYLPTAISGYEGVQPFKEPIGDLRVLATVFEAYEQLYILKSSGITSFEQIKVQKYPLKIGANIKASASEVLLKSAFDSYGITYKDIEGWGGKIMFLQTNPTNELIKGGSLEAHVGTFPVPFPTILQLNTNHPIRILSMSDETIEALVKKHGGTKGVIPGGTYKFQDDEIQTIKTYCLLLANKSLPADDAYNIAKAIDANREYLGVVHKALKKYSTALMATEHRIPFHDGALKYYREVGEVK